MTPGYRDSFFPLTPVACVLAALGIIALATSLTAPTPSFDPSGDPAFGGMPAPVATAPADADPVAVPWDAAPALRSRALP